MGLKERALLDVRTKQQTHKMRRFQSALAHHATQSEEAEVEVGRKKPELQMLHAEAAVPTAPWGLLVLEGSHGSHGPPSEL